MKRSPNYPSLPLEAAIEHISKAYPKTHRHKSDKMTIVRLLGYSSLNGASLTVLGALNQYGLLEGKTESIGISADAETIVSEPKNSQARSEAIERCAKKPAIFADMLLHFDEKLPADEIIRPYLIRKGFLTSAVDGPIRTLRENLDFVREESKRYTQEDTESIGERAEARIGASHAIENEGLHAHQHLSMKTDTFNLDEGQVTLTLPKQLSQSSLEDFESWIELVLRRARKSVIEDEDDPHGP